MKRLKLYRIERHDPPAVHVAARSREQAAQMYVTWEAAQELSGGPFSVELAELDAFDRDQRTQLERLLASSTEGVAHYDEGVGWVIDTAEWISFDTDEREPSGVRIFEMRDLTPIEAIVLASDYDRASELFEQHLRAHGGDPDALMYRELDLKHLESAARKAVKRALGLAREGLVLCDGTDRCVFVTPLGDP